VPTMAEQAFETKGSARRESLSGSSGMLAPLVAAAIVAVLYFAREVIVPIILAVLLSFLLALAVRWLRRLRLGGLAAVGLAVLVAF
jgi:predicted PurR-regulated permease PerM